MNTMLMVDISKQAVAKPINPLGNIGQQGMAKPNNPLGESGILRKIPFDITEP